MKWYDVWGTEATYNHMSAGWSWAFDTPFDWFKQNASRLGGIRQNMVVSWPAKITDKGGRRDQFMHVIDVVPTILEVTGHPGAEGGRRDRAGADRGHELRLHLRRRERRRAEPPHDPVFRDDGAVGALPRGLASQHQGQPRAVGRLRAGEPRPAEQPGVRALRPDRRHEPDQRHRRGQPREGRGDEGALRRGGQEVPGLPAGRLGRGPHRRAASEHHGGADRVRLHPADGRPAAGRLAAHPQRLLHDHGRDRRARGRRPRA